MLFYKKNLKIFLLLGIFCFSCKSLPLSQGEKHTVTTQDDWKLTIEHFPSRNTNQARKYPILVCHGLGANREYFKIKGNNSLIHALQEAGYDVWLMDLRGRNDAGETGFFFGKHTYKYSVDDYILKDLDAAIRFVMEKTGSKKLNYMGHSMGGIIMHARLGSFQESRIANFVAIASPMSFLPYAKLPFIAYRMRGAMALIPAIPVRFLGFTASYFPEALYASFIDAFLYKENTDEVAKAQLMRTSLNNIAKREINQFIYMTEHGGLFSADGKIPYRENLKNITIPVYLLAARRDELADPAIIRDVYERISSKDKTFEIFSRADGFSEDYGHTDIIIGKNAHKEVHPKIVEWLNKHN